MHDVVDSSTMPLASGWRQARLNTLLISGRWGEKSLVVLFISVVSGIVVALQYDPAAPFYSTSVIDIVVPFGRFWRSLHFYSSQLFFLLMALHLLAILLSPARVAIPFWKWVMLITTLPVVVLLLFTGYVLRGDATGESAGAIAENIALSLPLAGVKLNSLLFAISADGLKRIYANHVIGLGVLWLSLSWDHVRRYRLVWRQHGTTMIPLFLLCLLIDAPMEPMRFGVLYITGPWFFLGLQELLHYFQPVWAGLVFPSVLLGGLLLLRGAGAAGWGRRYRIAAVLVAGWLLVYLCLTVAALVR